MDEVNSESSLINTVTSHFDDEEPPTPECWKGSINSKAYPGTLLTLENSCLEGKLTFGDPLLDSGVAVSS